jgi:hypothetical protein
MLTQHKDLLLELGKSAAAVVVAVQFQAGL